MRRHPTVPRLRTLMLATAVAAALAACGSGDGGGDQAEPKTRAPAPDTSHGGYVGTVSAAPWTPLVPGGSGALRISADGTVSAGTRAFEPRLALRDAGGKDIAYRVSPPSPGARYAFVNGTAPEGTSYLYVADLRRGRLVPTRVLKYGPAPWVAYAADVPYGLLVSKAEGTAVLFAINLADGTSRQVDLSALDNKPKTAAVDETTLQWKDGRSFTVSATVACNAGLEDCRRDDGRKTTRRALVQLPEMQVHALP